MKQPQLLVNIAQSCRALVERADQAGIRLDDGNVVDLIADSLTELPLDTIRDALVVAGLAPRFPKATAKHRGN